MSNNLITNDRMNRYIYAGHLRGNLKSRSVKGGIVTVTRQALHFILQIASVAVLARMLTPKDFGLIAMVSTVLGFAHFFKEAGLSIATVQKEDITHDQVSTLFWINAGISILLSLIIMALSPLVA